MKASTPPPPQGVTGEASSNTFTSARGVYLRGPAMTRADLNVTMPELMYESSPFLRLIVIFRDPVDRYHSAFYYYRYGGRGGMAFCITAACLGAGGAVWTQPGWGTEYLGCRLHTSPHFCVQVVEEG